MTAEQLAKEFATTVLHMCIAYLKGKVRVTPQNLSAAIKKKIGDYDVKLHDIMHPSVFGGREAENYDKWDNDHTVLDGRKEDLSQMFRLDPDEASAENIDID